MNSKVKKFSLKKRRHLQRRALNVIYVINPVEVYVSAVDPFVIQCNINKYSPKRTI